MKGNLMLSFLGKFCKDTQNMVNSWPSESTKPVSAMTSF